MMTASYATKFHSRLNQFRVDGEFADVTIKCADGGDSFKCHRVALASASDFFLDTLRTNFKEHAANKIVLRGVSATIFREVLQFIYTGDATITADTFLDMFQASEDFQLLDLRDQCLSFLSSSVPAFPVNNFLDIYLYAYENKKEQLMKIVAPQLAAQFELFSKVDAFFKVPFQALHELVISRLSLSELLPNSDEVILAAIVEWVLHDIVDRLQYYARLKKLISHSNISPQFTEFLTDKSPVSPMPPFTPAMDLVPVAVVEASSFQEALLLYVRYATEDTIQIYTVPPDSSPGTCFRSGEIFQKNSNQRFTSLAFNDVFLYRMHYFGEEGACSSDTTAQTFSAHPSADMQTALPLKCPPICFEKVDLCAMQNNIYAYHENLPSNPMRTASVPSSRTFEDQEILRGIYVYNCEVDDWFPVPEMKKKLAHSAIAVLDNNLFLIGGGIDEDMDYVQAYDSREGIWRALPRTQDFYLGASAFVLQGKIHVVGGYASGGCERFDQVAGKWETLLELESIEQTDSKAIVYRDRILLFNRDPIPPEVNSTSTGYYLDFQEGTYCSSKESPERKNFHWGDASINLTIENPTNLVDCVVFKKI